MEKIKSLVKNCLCTYVMIHRLNNNGFFDKTLAFLHFLLSNIFACVKCVNI